MSTIKSDQTIVKVNDKVIERAVDQIQTTVADPIQITVYSPGPDFFTDMMQQSLDEALKNATRLKLIINERQRLLA